MHSIAFPNYRDYDNSIRFNSDKSETFRYFVNSAESFNNILDYLYYENEDEISSRGLNLKTLRKQVHSRHEFLSKISDFANGYKHSIREYRGNKNESLPWAKNLSSQTVTTRLSVKDGQFKSETEFDLSIPDVYTQALHDTFEFWIDYLKTNNIENLV